MITTRLVRVELCGSKTITMQNKQHKPGGLFYTMNNKSFKESICQRGSGTFHPGKKLHIRKVEQNRN